MTRLARYIFAEAFRPFVFFGVALTAIVWLSQSLRYVDVIVNQGQSAGIFLYLIVLMLPSLLIFVLPAALLIGTFYALYRLQSDSELIVLAAAGQSRLKIAYPLLLLGLLAAGMQLAVNLYLMPVGQRVLKDRMYQIQGDLASNILREGQFTTPSDGLTVYVRERSGSATARGILVHDNREPEKPTTYMAEVGEIVPSDAGPRFVLVNGSVQRRDEPSRVATLQFDRYVIDMAPFQRGERDNNRGTKERYLNELLAPPDAATLGDDRKRAYFAEGHDRLSSPLYNIVFVLIPAAAVLSAGSARRSIAMRVGLGAFVALSVRMVGLAIRGAVGGNPALWPFLYLAPVIGIIIGILWLAGVRFWPARIASAPAESPV